MNNFNVAGVTAGASTPDWIIDEVIEYLKEMIINNNKTLRFISKCFLMCLNGKSKIKQGKEGMIMPELPEVERRYYILT